MVRVVCEAYDIDEEFAQEDMPTILEFILAEKIAEKHKISKNHKTPISLRIFTQDLEFFKKEAEKTGENYGELIREALAEYRQKYETMKM